LASQVGALVRSNAVPTLMPTAKRITVLQESVAGVAVVENPVKANDLTGHLEPRDLIAAIFGIDAGLEEAGADGKQGFEGFTVTKQRGAVLDLAACGHYLVDPGQLLRAHADRHAQLTQVAIGTRHFHGLRVHDLQVWRAYQAHMWRGLRGWRGYHHGGAFSDLDQMV